MFDWNADAIRFRIDAAEHGGFDEKIARRIARYIPRGASVCDAGCGLGYIALALARAGYGVTAVDSSSAAIAVLRSHAKGLDNLTAVNADLFSMTPEEKYDAMVFCFFGRIAETLKAAKAQCRGEIFLIKKNWETHRFKLREEPLEAFTYEMSRKELDGLGVKYGAEVFSPEMGQPFRSIEDAAAFFRLFDHGNAGMRREDIEPRLVATGSPDFPYYLPSCRPLGLIRIKTADIPENIVDKKEKAL